ncbi:MAG: hypothetical protein FWF43_09615 [Propionibacteriaceae bacterium]|nr:hypothetical protein [Propionibacteriaceae bacterium]
MPTLIVRELDDAVYEDLKRAVARHNRSVEAEASELIRIGVVGPRRWEGATLADLSSGPQLEDLDTPFVRVGDTPRDTVLIRMG